MIATYKKIWLLLSQAEKKKALLLLVLMVTTALLEVGGVGSIMPFLAVLGDAGIIEENAYLSWVYNYFNFQETNTFLLFLGFSAMFVLVFSASFKTLTYYALYKFANLRRDSLSKKLFTKYLQQPYSFFLTKNSSSILKTMLSEVDLLITQILIPSLMLITYAIIFVVLTLFLVFINPMLALILVLLFGGFYTVVYLAVRKYLVHIGNERERANTERFKIVSETIGGIKDLKVLGREEVYSTSFKKPSLHFSLYSAYSSTLSAVPQFLLEVIAFGSILVMAMYSLVAGESHLGSLLPVLGLYALAALKLKPATNQIYSALSYLKFGAPSLKLILTELQRVESQEVHSLENNHERLKFKSALTLHNLSFKYDTSHLILKDIDMTIRAKTTVGIIGKTGAGKSTLIDLILGLLHPTSGEVLVDGEVLTKENVRSWQNAIGYVPQTIFLSDDTIANNIAFGIPREAIDQEQVIKVAKMAQIDSFIETLENGYHTEVGERGVRLSGGQRQRLGIARALYHKPDLLLLDEATSALDTQTEKALMESIDNMHGDITIVMIAHRLNTVEKCDMIIHLEDGRLKEE